MTGADIGIGWVDSSGQLFFQVYALSLVECEVYMPLSRIDMHLETKNRSSTLQPLIGSVYKVDNKMAGQLFSSDVSLTHVTRWMFRSK